MQGLPCILCFILRTIICCDCRLQCTEISSAFTCPDSGIIRVVLGVIASAIDWGVYPTVVATFLMAFGITPGYPPELPVGGLHVISPSPVWMVSVGWAMCSQRRRLCFPGLPACYLQYTTRCHWRYLPVSWLVETYCSYLALLVLCL